MLLSIVGSRHQISLLTDNSDDYNDNDDGFGPPSKTKHGIFQ